MKGRRFAVALVVAGALLAPARGEARPTEPATAVEAAALAETAATDDAALAELRSITEVDGVPVDLAAATADLGADRRSRLLALAAVLAGDEPVGDPGARDPDAARTRAEEVLAADKYQETRLPRPFKGPLEWLADRLRPVGDAIDDVAGSIPGGRGLLLVGLGIALGALTWWATTRTGRAKIANARWSVVDPAADPAELDRAADDAEAAGDHATAVRRRYEAGLLRLAREGRIDLRPDTTPASVAAALGDQTVDRLTATFEEVVYGGRGASVADADEARDGWRAVLGIGSRR